ncbi:hypothetical protein [Streptomyces parvus]|uniref:hypothetical protein n=1 Tax=Streptomyces parvus TaxID=66428 RepID=UPI003D709D48
MGSLTIWLDRGPEDEDDIKSERDAAIALSTGDYPPHTNDVGNADEEDDEAEQLLACAAHDMPVQRRAPDGSALPAETLLQQWDHESLTHA